MAKNNLVPTPETGVTRAWLRSALADALPNATFASLEQRRIGEDYGFASHILRCRWQDDGTQKSVVMKLWDTDTKAGIGELCFYRTFTDVGARVPECYYSAVNEREKKAVLVLEDLAGAVQGDILEPLDLGRAKGVARALASLHAAWLAHPKLGELVWLEDVSIWSPEREWFASRRSLYLERFPEHLNGPAQLLLDTIELAPRMTNERLANVPKTLLHGDFHLDNLVFERQTEPVLLDWSRPVRGPAARNLAVLLFLMTPLENFDEVFACYLGTFNMLSEPPLEHTGLEKQVGGELLRLFTASTCGIARWRPSLPRAKKVFRGDAEAMNKSVAFWQERDPELFTFLR